MRAPELVPGYEVIFTVFSHDSRSPYAAGGPYEACECRTGSLKEAVLIAETVQERRPNTVTRITVTWEKRKERVEG